MFTNITIGRYIYKNSLIHRINPLFKIIIVLIVLVSSIMFNLSQNLLLLVCTMIIIDLTKIDKNNYFKNIYGFRYFILGLIIIYILSKLSIIVMLNNMLKIIINILVTSILLYTTTLNELNYGLYKFVYPLKYIKIDPNKLSVILTLAIKFIGLVFEETNVIFKAFKNRGLDFSGNIKIRIKKIKMFLSTLIYLLLKKAEDISNTLYIRNCDLEKLVEKNKYKITYLDIFFLIDIVLVIILMFKTM